MKNLTHVMLLCLCALGTSNAMERRAPAGPAMPPAAAQLSINQLGRLGISTNGRVDVVYSPDNRYVIVQTSDAENHAGAAALVRVDAGANWHVQGFTNTRLAFSNTGRFVVAVGETQTKILLTATGNCMFAVETQETAIHWAGNDSACVIDDGGESHFVRFDREGAEAEIQSFDEDFAGFSPDGSVAYFHGNNACFSVTDQENAPIHRADATHEIVNATVSPDGRIIAITTTANDGSHEQTFLYNTANGLRIGQATDGRFVEFNPSSTRCILQHEPRHISLHATDDFRQIGDYNRPADDEYNVWPISYQFMLGGNALRVGGAYYETRTGAQITHQRAINAAIESPNHAVLALSHKTGTRTITALVHADGHEAEEIDDVPVFFSPDGGILVTCSTKKVEGAEGRKWQASGFDTATGVRVWGPIFGRLYDSVHQGKTGHNNDFFALGTGNQQTCAHRISDGTPVCTAQGTFGSLTPWGAITQYAHGRTRIISNRHADIRINGNIAACASNGSGFVTASPDLEHPGRTVITIFGVQPSGALAPASAPAAAATDSGEADAAGSDEDDEPASCAKQAAASSTGHAQKCPRAMRTLLFVPMTGQKPAKCPRICKKPLRAVPQRVPADMPINTSSPRVEISSDSSDDESTPCAAIGAPAPAAAKNIIDTSNDEASSVPAAATPESTVQPEPEQPAHGQLRTRESDAEQAADESRLPFKKRRSARDSDGSGNGQK